MWNGIALIVHSVHSQQKRLFVWADFNSWAIVIMLHVDTIYLNRKTISQNNVFSPPPLRFPFALCFSHSVNVRRKRNYIVGEEKKLNRNTICNNNNNITKKTNNNNKKVNAACDQCTPHDHCDDNVFDTHWKMCTHRMIPFPGPPFFNIHTHTRTAISRFLVNKDWATKYAT